MGRHTRGRHRKTFARRVRDAFSESARVIDGVARRVGQARAMAGAVCSEWAWAAFGGASFGQSPFVAAILVDGQFYGNLDVEQTTEFAKFDTVELDRPEFEKWPGADEDWARVLAEMPHDMNSKARV